jgi:hypothetical protein
MYGWYRCNLNMQGYPHYHGGARFYIQGCVRPCSSYMGFVFRVDVIDYAKGSYITDK